MPASAFRHSARDSGITAVAGPVLSGHWRLAEAARGVDVDHAAGTVADPGSMKVALPSM